jgi:hypothetical protein
MEEVSFFCSHFDLHKVYVSASQLLLLLLFSSFVFLMETDNSLLERCCVATLRVMLADWVAVGASDQVRGVFRIPDDKVGELIRLCAMCGRRWRSRRQLAQLTGMVSAVSRAAPLLRLYTCELFRLISTELYGWNWAVRLTDLALADIREIASHTSCRR